jgi:hypothetical protein
MRCLCNIIDWHTAWQTCSNTYVHICNDPLFPMPFSATTLETKLVPKVTETDELLTYGLVDQTWLNDHIQTQNLYTDHPNLLT